MKIYANPVYTSQHTPHYMYTYLYGHKYLYAYKYVLRNYTNLTHKY